MEALNPRDLENAKLKVRKFQKISNQTHTKVKLSKRTPKIVTKSGVTLHILEGSLYLDKDKLEVLQDKHLGSLDYEKQMLGRHRRSNLHANIRK